MFCSAGIFSVQRYNHCHTARISSPSIYRMLMKTTVKHERIVKWNGIQIIVAIMHVCVVFISLVLSRSVELEYWDSTRPNGSSRASQQFLLGMRVQWT